MEGLPVDEVSRIRPLLSEDEDKRDRRQFVYAFDIFKRNWTVPYSIWPIPNSDVIRVIGSEVDYNKLPFDNQNEFEKGLLFEDQRQFIAQHISEEPMLCEARNHKPCLQEKCPIFRAKNTKEGGEHGICSEFKIAFWK
jgi:hypothetical protein